MRRTWRPDSRGSSRASRRPVAPPVRRSRCSRGLRSRPATPAPAARARARRTSGRWTRPASPHRRPARSAYPSPRRSRLPAHRPGPRTRRRWPRGSAPARPTACGATRRIRRPRGRSPRRSRGLPVRRIPQRSGRSRGCGSGTCSSCDHILTCRGRLAATVRPLDSAAHRSRSPIRRAPSAHVRHQPRQLTSPGIPARPASTARRPRADRPAAAAGPPARSRRPTAPRPACRARQRRPAARRPADRRC